MLPQRTPPVRVTLCIADEALRMRVVRACGLAGVVTAAAGEGADVVLADRPVETAAPVIAFPASLAANTALSGSGSAAACDIRAEVPADIDAMTLAAVIAAVAAGFTVMPVRARNRAANTTGSWAGQPYRHAEGDEIPVLTPREREVLALLAEGASNKAIARALSVSVHTAKFHVASVAEKLGASGRLEAVAIAIRSGLVMV